MRFLGSQATKHRAMKRNEAQGSSLETSKGGKHTEQLQKGKKDMEVRWHIGVLLGAVFKNREDP
jgi:hypothetical protein